MRGPRMMRRATWHRWAPPLGVAFVMLMLAVEADLGWRSTLLVVGGPAVLVLAVGWAWHARRLRAVHHAADAGIRSLEVWLAHQGHGRRS